MLKQTLNKEELKLAEELSYYYEFPERTSSYDKERLNQVKAANPNIHYMALQILRNKYRRYQQLTG